MVSPIPDRKQVVDNENGLTWENNERWKKITFFIFNIGMIPIFSGRFSWFPISSIINIAGFINIFLYYLTLTRLDVGIFKDAGLCTFGPCCAYCEWAYEQRGLRGAFRPWPTLIEVKLNRSLFARRWYFLPQRFFTTFILNK